MTIAIVGLDVSVESIAACFLLDDGGEPLPRWEVTNTQPGAAALAERLASLAQQHGVTELRLGLEATSLYWFPLACALKEAVVLAPYHPQIYTLNPKLVHDFRCHYGPLPKTDRAVAFVIAKRIRFGRQLPRPFQIDLRYAPLQRLTRFRMHVAQTLAREKSHFLTFLSLRFSGFCQDTPFHDPFGATSCVLLDDFTTEEPASADVTELASYLTTKGWGQFRAPADLAVTLKRAAQSSYHLETGLSDPLTAMLSTTLATIRTLQRQIQELDRTIAKELQGIPQTLSSVPGLGPVWTAGLVAEMGDIHRFADHAALAEYAGLVWQVRESGSFQAEDRKTRKELTRPHSARPAKHSRTRLVPATH